MPAPVPGTSCNRSRSMTHAECNALLRRRHNEQASVPRNVRLPSEAGIRVGGDLDRATLFLNVNKRRTTTSPKIGCHTRIL